MANSAHTSASSAAPQKSPVTIAIARSIGGDPSLAWINQDSDVIGTAAEWRARCLAAFTLYVQDQPDFLPLVNAYQDEFDNAPHAASSIGTQDAPANDLEMADLCDDIDCAISVLRDLLVLARQECPTGADNACKAESAIRAAGRYVDDIEALNARLYARLYARQAAAIQAEIGGAA